MGELSFASAHNRDFVPHQQGSFGGVDRIDIDAVADQCIGVVDPVPQHLMGHGPQAPLHSVVLNCFPHQLARWPKDLHRGLQGHTAEAEYATAAAAEGVGKDRDLRLWH